MQFSRFLIPTAAALSVVSGIQLDVADTASIKDASSAIVYDMLKTWYTGNTSSNPADYGTLSLPYYWWEAGAMFGGLVNYAHYTGDTSYDETIAKAIVSQASNTTDFMMIETRALELGNDDILFWTLTAMNAAEYNFHVPAGVSKDIYFQLGRNVFNLMVSRWNTTTCGGGLKWQWIPTNNGFYYKSTITNSAFFQVAARLGRMTGNQTYFDWANKAYDWMTTVGYIDSNYNVLDGAGDAGTDNCKILDTHEWSYNIASTLAGAAYMYNATGDIKWRNRTRGFLDTVKTKLVQPFANSTNIIYERECEATTCSVDQLSFKAYLSQSLGKASVVFPEIKDEVMTILKASAAAAAKTCTAGATGRLCGTKWYIGGSDGSTGVGQQMTAFQTISSLLVDKVSGPIKRADNPGNKLVSSSTISSSTSTTATSTTSETVSTTASSTPSSSPGGGLQKPTVQKLGFLAHEGEFLSDCLCIQADKTNS